MENSTYALVLTGDVLPGYAPESVWPALAGYFHMEPAKLSAQLLPRAPLTIKQSDDLGKLQTLQGGAAAIGADTEICAPDGRANLFVVLDNAPRGPMPRVFVDARVEHGLWANSVMVAAVGANTWKPYRDFDAEAIAASAPPVAAPAAEDMFESMAAKTESMPLALMPLANADTGDGVFAPLPPGLAIHAGFWRRCAALIIDSILVGIGIAILQVAIGLGALGGMAGGQMDVGAMMGSMFLIFALAFVGQWLYFAVFESASMQGTPGKRAMGLKVVDLSGQRIGFGRASGRFFGKLISTMIFDIGYMLAGWTERKQALHDMIASTLVVFRDVQPGQPMPTVRPPMPWYGWLLNVLLVALVPLSILAAVALSGFQH
ncbi:MAG: RDD family protein [Dokdonella sp.]